MSVISVESRQEVLRRVLQSLAAAQPAAVAVRLCTRVADGPAGVRGLLNPVPRPVAAPADESALPAPFREEGLRTLPALRLGQELQVVVSAPAGGHLHLFNLGCTGEARRMVPRPGEAAPRLEAGRSFLASPDAAGQTWVEKGPLNGFPERVLAIVTAEARSVPPTSLHPSWSDTAYTRGFGAPIVDSLVSAWPVTEWSWGLAEAAVA